jgi:recombination protein RecA
LNDFSLITLRGKKVSKYFVDKTRFCRPFQHIQIEVPYDEGMNPYSGLLDAAVALGVIEKNGSWFTFEGSKFQKSDETHLPKILAKMIELEENGIVKDITTGPTEQSEDVIFVDVD